jgi:hypothetical protein
VNAIEKNLDVDRSFVRHDLTPNADVAEIVTSKGDRILIDAVNLEVLSEFSWRLNQNGYAITGAKDTNGRGGSRKILMHRLLAGLERGDAREVDHINGNRIDNRMSNLRICTHGQNTLNRAKQPNTKSGLKGVSEFHGRWQARIARDGTLISLGTFATPEEAHAAYCEAADVIHGEFANHGHETIREQYSQASGLPRKKGKPRASINIPTSDLVPPPVLSFAPGETIDSFERRYIEATLRYHGGNRHQTALVLGISPKTLYNKLKEWGVDQEQISPLRRAARSIKVRVSELADLILESSSLEEVVSYWDQLRVARRMAQSSPENIA